MWKRKENRGRNCSVLKVCVIQNVFLFVLVCFTCVVCGKVCLNLRWWVVRITTVSNRFMFAVFYMCGRVYVCGRHTKDLPKWKSVCDNTRHVVTPGSSPAAGCGGSRCLPQSEHTYMYMYGSQHARTAISKTAVAREARD